MSRSRRPARCASIFMRTFVASSVNPTLSSSLDTARPPLPPAAWAVGAHGRSWGALLVSDLDNVDVLRGDFRALVDFWVLTCPPDGEAGVDDEDVAAFDRTPTERLALTEPDLSVLWAEEWPVVVDLAAFFGDAAVPDAVRPPRRCAGLGAAFSGESTELAPAVLIKL